MLNKNYYSRTTYIQMVKSQNYNVPEEKAAEFYAVFKSFKTLDIDI